MPTQSKPFIAILTVAGICLLIADTAAAATSGKVATPDASIRAAEAWAFPQFPPLADLQAPPPHPKELVHIAGSSRSYTQAQLDGDFVPDWFPQDHPQAPALVLRRPQLATPGHKRPAPCGECHLPNGAGVPATAQVVGLPKPYILEQFAAFQHGQRGASAPRTTQDMADEARAVGDADLQLVADYFSRLEFVPHTRVVESATIPKMHWKYFAQVPDKDNAREPIGERIVETPVNFCDYRYGSDRTTYVAYVPPGSIARGAAIAERGVRAAPSCESCHGAKLQGMGIIPPLAGRSPTYIARELILFRTGQRNNPEAAPMRAEAAQLDVNDMIAVAAYAASRKP